VLALIACIAAISFIFASAAGLAVDGGTIQAQSIHGGPHAGGPAVPPECAGMSFAMTVVGTDGDDVITAANGGSLIFGRGGNDTIAGGNGKDCITGGDGDDLLDGGGGADALLGGPGDDTIQGGNGPDLIVGGDGVDQCDGGNGADAISDCEGPSPATAPREAIDGDVTDPDRPHADGGQRVPDDPVTPTPDPRAGRERLLEPCPGDADCVIYVVRPGDNLVSIVRFFEVSLADTLDLNPWLDGAAYLPMGAELRLPRPDWLPGRPSEPGSSTTPMATATATPAPDPTPDPAVVPTPEATPDPTLDPTPDPTPERTPEPTADPGADATPDPLPEPTPTA
jgi:hypothetical protein